MISILSMYKRQEKLPENTSQETGFKWLLVENSLIMKMKCINCKNEWICYEGVDYPQKCPYCGCPISDNLSQFYEVRRFIKDHEDSIFKDRKRFVGLLSDLLPGMKKEQNLLRMAFDERLFQMISDIGKDPFEIKVKIRNAKRIAIEDMGVSKENANLMVDAICYITAPDKEEEPKLQYKDGDYAYLELAREYWDKKRPIGEACYRISADAGNADAQLEYLTLLDFQQPPDIDVETWLSWYANIAHEKIEIEGLESIKTPGYYLSLADYMNYGIGTEQDLPLGFSMLFVGCKLLQKYQHETNGKRIFELAIRMIFELNEELNTKGIIYGKLLLQELNLELFGNWDMISEDMKPREKAGVFAVISNFFTDDETEKRKYWIGLAFENNRYVYANTYLQVLFDDYLLRKDPEDMKLIVDNYSWWNRYSLTSLLSEHFPASRDLIMRMIDDPSGSIVFDLRQDQTWQQILVDISLLQSSDLVTKQKVLTVLKKSSFLFADPLISLIDYCSKDNDEEYLKLVYELTDSETYCEEIRGHLSSLPKDYTFKVTMGYVEAELAAAFIDYFRMAVSERRIQSYKEILKVAQSFEDDHWLFADNDLVQETDESIKGYGDWYAFLSNYENEAAIHKYVPLLIRSKSEKRVAEGSVLLKTMYKGFDDPYYMKAMKRLTRHAIDIGLKDIAAENLNWLSKYDDEGWITDEDPIWFRDALLRKGYWKYSDLEGVSGEEFLTIIGNHKNYVEAMDILYSHNVDVKKLEDYLDEHFEKFAM